MLMGIYIERMDRVDVAKRRKLVKKVEKTDTFYRNSSHTQIGLNKKVDRIDRVGLTFSSARAR